MDLNRKVMKSEESESGKWMGLDSRVSLLEESFLARNNLINNNHESSLNMELELERLRGNLEFYDISIEGFFFDNLESSSTRLWKALNKGITFQYLKLSDNNPGTLQSLKRNFEVLTNRLTNHILRNSGSMKKETNITNNMIVSLPKKISNFSVLVFNGNASYFSESLYGEALDNMNSIFKRVILVDINKIENREVSPNIVIGLIRDPGYRCEINPIDNLPSKNIFYVWVKETNKYSTTFEYPWDLSDLKPKDVRGFYFFSHKNWSPSFVEEIETLLIDYHN